MLTEKDYCDYDTCVALKKLGYKEKTLAYYTSEGIFYWRRAYIYDVTIPDLAKSSNKEQYKHVVDAVGLYEAQKWLREEKHIDVLVYLDDLKGYFPFIRIWEGSWKTFISLEEMEGEKVAYSANYEEALSEGVRTAIEILKEK